MAYSAVRIIGGKWRSRRIQFLVQQVLRPTPNLIRETLFNWLTPMITEAICLDAFAGSGALGLEALSRGAQWVSFLDKSNRITQHLKKQIDLLEGTPYAAVHCMRFPPTNPSKLLSKSSQKFNLVFLDPPFQEGLLAPSLAYLSCNDLLQAGAWVYIEHETTYSLSVLPSAWRVLKQKKTGHVCYGLLEWTT
jgi:16S rRNA (guanine966-N2)-methyltransferase